MLLSQSGQLGRVVFWAVRTSTLFTGHSWHSLGARQITHASQAILSRLRQGAFIGVDVAPQAKNTRIYVCLFYRL
jgi:hypothetical protein